MNLRTIFSSLVLGAAVTGLVLAPVTAQAGGFDKDKDKNKKKGKPQFWNGHDNGLHRGHYKDGKWVEEVIVVKGQSEYDRRQQTKNEWRNIALAAGALSIIGLINKDSTLTFAGAAGALYAAHRYEEDRKSQNKMNRTRAYYFSKPYFVRDGRRYERRTVWVKGQKYYRFVKC